MYVYIWSETLDTGAYHKDGSAIVVAHSLDEARQLLAEDELESRSSYHWAEPVSHDDPDFVLKADDSEQPRVVVTEVGCDC